MNEDTFTEAEIEEALSRLVFHALHASDITDVIKAHREPKWRAGDVVKDANGVVWLRAYNSARDRVGWERPGTNGFFNHNAPMRPLKRMVEES